MTVCVCALCALCACMGWLMRGLCHTSPQDGRHESRHESARSHDSHRDSRATPSAGMITGPNGERVVDPVDLKSRDEMEAERQAIKER